MKINDSNWLDDAICYDLRETINSIPRRSKKKYYNLCCAVMDRVDDCLEILNSYSQIPKSDSDFMVFMMYACMVCDAVKQLLLAIKEANDCDESISYEETDLFSKIYIHSSVYNSETHEDTSGKNNIKFNNRKMVKKTIIENGNRQEYVVPTDEHFFEYLRTLVFAHPFDTRRPKFLSKNEIQSSPWVSVDPNKTFDSSYKNPVRICVYSTIDVRDWVHIDVPFATIKEYVARRYNQLGLATKWIKDEYEQRKSAWRKKPLNRDLPLPELLQQMYEHYIEHAEKENGYWIELLQRYLLTEISAEINRVPVEAFKTEIKNALPKICDAIDYIENERVIEICDQLFKSPKLSRPDSYSLMKALEAIRKIRREYPSQNYLSDSFSKYNVNQIANGFAKRWVVINANAMAIDELELLIATACYHKHISALEFTYFLQG